MNDFEYRARLIRAIQEEIGPLSLPLDTVYTDDLESILYAAERGMPNPSDLWWEIHAKRDAIYATGLLTCTDATDEEKQWAKDTLSRH